MYVCIYVGMCVCACVYLHQPELLTQGLTGQLVHLQRGLLIVQVLRTLFWVTVAIQMLWAGQRHQAVP